MYSWLLGGTQSISNKVNFEDIQSIIKNNNSNFLLINTLPKTEQNCLIRGTISVDNEVDIINTHLKKAEVSIIIYGKNTNDRTLIKKHNQLLQLGFNKVYIYLGGLFEWLCLQDIYGKNSFPTIGEELDILKYRSPPEINKNYYIDNK